MFILDSRAEHTLSLAFSPDAVTLYVGYEFSGAYTWNLTDRTAHPVMMEGESVKGGFWLHPGGRWAFGLWHAESNAPYMPHLIDLLAGTARPINFAVYAGRGIAPAPDGSHFATIGHSTFDEDRPAPARCYRLYDWTMTPTGPEYAWHQDVPPNVLTKAVVALGSDQFATGETVTGAPPSMWDTATRHEQIAIRHARGGAPVAALDFPHSQLHQLLASPDGTKLVARTGTELRVWDASNWAKPPVVVGGTLKSEMPPPAACFHPSGDYLLLANGASSVLAYETRTWKPVRKWNWKAGALRAVAISADGTLAAAGGPRGAIVLWDLDL